MLQKEKEQVVNVARGPGCLHAALGMDPGEGEGGRDAPSLPQPRAPVAVAQYGHQRALLANLRMFFKCRFPPTKLKTRGLAPSKPEGG